jgi:hypothetical protein
MPGRRTANKWCLRVAISTATSYSYPIFVNAWRASRSHERFRFRLQTHLTAPSKFHSRLAVGILLSLAFDLFFLNGVPIDPLRFGYDIKSVVDNERSTAKSKKRRVTVWICSFDDVQQVAFGLITVKILSILPIVDSDGLTDQGRCISGQLLDSPNRSLFFVRRDVCEKLERGAQGLRLLTGLLVLGVEYGLYFTAMRSQGHDFRFEFLNSLSVRRMLCAQCCVFILQRLIRFLLYPFLEVSSERRTDEVGRLSFWLPYGFSISHVSPPLHRKAALIPSEFWTPAEAAVSSGIAQDPSRTQHSNKGSFIGKHPSVYRRFANVCLRQNEG